MWEADRDRVSPSPAWLGERVAATVSVRIAEGMRALHPTVGDGQVVDVRDPRDVRAVVDLLAIEEGPSPSCFGDGEEVLLALTLHHGLTIRCDAWSADGVLRDAEGLWRWLWERGVQSPQEDRAFEVAEHAEWDAAVKQWIAAMPAPLQPIVHPIGPTGCSSGRLDLSALATASEVLARAFPSEAERVLALYRWFGCGTGVWSGYHSYESFALQILMEYPTPSLINAVKPLGEQDAPVLEGFMRLCCSWEFRKRLRAKKNRHLFDEPLQQAMLDYAAESDDEDKAWAAKEAIRKLRRPVQ